MSQLTRTEIKGKFKRGMYPTEQDFGNAFDSYVHKDDMVELEKIVQTIDGEQKALTTIINETKDQAIAAAVEQAVAEVGKDVSNKKFCEIIDDLDASDAEVGTIAIYGGQTNDKYTHGFIYEKGEGGEGGKIITLSCPKMLGSGWLEGGPFYSNGVTEPLGVYNVMTFTDSEGNYVGKAELTPKSGAEDTELSHIEVYLEDQNRFTGYDGFASNCQYSVEHLPGTPSWTPLNVMNVIN